MFENEGSPESVSEVTSSPEPIESSSDDTVVSSHPAEQDRHAEKVVSSKPEPESLKSKMEKKMAGAKARDEARGVIQKGETDPNITLEKGKKEPTPAAPAAPEKPAYQPNFKYKFTDESQKQQEKDLPEWAKAAIKDPESEKEIRSVFEKAGGLDFVLPRFKKTREELEAVKPRLSAYDNNVSEMKDMYSKGNMQGIFDKLGLAEEKVLQWAVDRAKYYQLPPEQQSIIKAQQDAERNAHFAEQQASTAQEKYEEQARQIKQLQLSTVLQRPEVTQAEKAFDERVGKKGAFFDQVKLHGETTWYRTGGKVDLTPEQAIAQVMEMYGLNGEQMSAGIQQPAQAPAAAQMAANQPPAQHQAPPVKVIPNVGSRSNSPAAGRSKPRSIEDLRRISKELQG